MTDKEAMVVAALFELVLSCAQATQCCQMLNEVCATHQFTVRQPKDLLYEGRHFVGLSHGGETACADVALTP
jgi:hypothetical protein